MPLRVKCPNGCLIQMPANRAGRVVRCPKCKTAIRVARISDWITAPAESIPIGASERFSGSEEVVNQNPENEFNFEDAATEKLFEVDRVSNRADRARRDRVLMARFLAVFLVVVALVNIAPAVVNWVSWSNNPIAGALPRWTFLQIFVAALLIIYSMFVFQVADWSSLKAVSIALLVLAAMFGFVSAGLVIGGGDGTVAIFLGLPYVMLRNATIWCVAMLLLALVASYLSGREAFNWQRIDTILDRIVNSIG